ncbi:MAG: hypothetical protein KAJ55_15075 [Anaerolineales bacterium]|nr:hypothetical protein [Anaerolineales bacterium]
MTDGILRRDGNEVMNVHLVAVQMLQGHPKLVERTMSYTDVVDKPRINPVRLQQIGHFRQKPDQLWMPMTAEQRCIITTPSLP